MENSNLRNIEALSNKAFPLDSLTENRIHTLKSLTQLLLNELNLLENLHLRKDMSFIDETISLSQEVENFEVKLIRLALARAKGCQRLAARLSRTKTSTLCTKIKRYGIESQGITFTSTTTSEKNDFVSVKLFS